MKKQRGHRGINMLV